ncbi:MAG: hypothetical protein WAZ18_02265 [Alphaproteobacteria bacterium]
MKYAPRRTTALTTAAVMLVGLTTNVMARPTQPPNKLKVPVTISTNAFKLPIGANEPRNPDLAPDEKADGITLDDGTVFAPSSVLEKLQKGQEGR